MNTPPTRAGERTRARRFLVFGIAVASSAAVSLHATDSSAPPDVTVRNDRGVYSVSAQFRVPQTVPVVLAVLTDYEQIPRFMPNVRSSVVRQRSTSHVVVEQEAVARLMMFSKRIHLLLDVCTDDDTVRFRDSSGRSFTHYEGAWRVVRRGNQTLLTYELSAQPSFDVPDFVLTRLLKRDARQMIENLREEIASRSR